VEEFVFEVAEEIVTWLLKKQPTMAASSVEAKYIA